ncbi:MAG TPA: DegT/DnrJ/EryC1/StrS family aminotransferase [Minicystis sp.]|nr:DegT/DnrJ/EryC1/StrS family aminotransferase [Minicystis sp.]
MSPAVPALLGGAPAVDAKRHVRWPVLGEDDRNAVLRVIDRGVLSGPWAPEVRGLEREYAAYVGAKHAVATNSGTAALHLAIAAAGIGPGDEVITSAYSFVATALAVLQANAVPVFVDVERRSYGLDPALVEKAITERTKAILPVHIHGTPCDVEAIADVAKRRGLTLLEDAAQAHGAAIGARKVGTFGRAGCFSLQSSKNLACGEGGILVTDDEDFALRARSVRAFGEDVKPTDEAGYRIERALDGDRAYDSAAMGWMYRPTELACAVARSQLRRLDAWNEAARANAAVLCRRLGALPGVEPVGVPDGRTGSIHKFRVRFDATKVGVDAEPKVVRDALVRALRAEGAEVVLWQTVPVPAQTLFRRKIGYGKGCPWDHAAPVDYDLAQYPETTALLASSIVLFSQTCPIACQPAALADAYADAFEKVWARLPDVVAAGAHRAAP